MALLHSVQQSIHRPRLTASWRRKRSRSALGICSDTCLVRGQLSACKSISFSVIMPRPLGGGIKRWCCLTSDVCLTSVAYIGPKSRTRRLRKTKIGIEVPHVTRDSVTTFKVKRSKVKVTKPLCSPPCWRVRRLQRWACERVGRGKLLQRCRLLGGARRFGAHGGRRGAKEYRGGRPPTACFLLQ